MRPGPGRPAGVWIRAGAAPAAGLLGGAIVGLVDGVRAALIVGVDARDVLVAALLAASVDALLGVVAAATIFGLARVALWGRRGAIATTRWGPALMLAGAATIGVTVAVFAATLDRHNRLLAGGITAMATLGAAVVMAALAPAAARAASGRRVRAGREPHGFRLDPAMFLLLPFVGVMGEIMITLAVERARPPFGAPATQRIVLQLAFVAAALPALLIATERLPVRLRLGIAGPAALVVYATALAALVHRTWSNHLRFLPWTHLLCGLAIAVVTTAVAIAFGRRALRAGPWWAKAAGVGAALIVTLGASESEPARKAVSRAGLAGPVLAQMSLVRRSF